MRLINRALRARPTRLAMAAVISGILLVSGVADAVERLALSDLPPQLQDALEAPLRGKLGQIGRDKDEDGIQNSNATYSRLLTKVDDATYEVAMVVKTAGKTTLDVQQLKLTLRADSANQRSWSIVDEQVVRDFDVLRRPAGYSCYPFETFTFDREGLKMSARDGQMCEIYLEGEVDTFIVSGKTVSYDYTPPEYLDYFHSYGFLQKDYPKQMEFDAQGFQFNCDGKTCEELIESSFTGLSRRPAAERSPELADMPTGSDSRLTAYAEKLINEVRKQRRDNPFADFRRPVDPGRRFYQASVRKNPDEGVGITYDSWGGFEVTFWIQIDWPDVGTQVAPVFGYYTDETLASTAPYELEKRDDYQRMYYDLATVNGTVEAGLDDPEFLKGDVAYTVNIKRDLDVMEFFVATKPRENVRRPSLFINTVDYDGQDLLWVQTTPFSGMIVFPETIEAGSQIPLRIVFASRALEKVNTAFSRTPRGGWLPLVTFGDFIDRFELTLKVPSQYKPLGVGKKISEEIDGDVNTSHWLAENPVEFPSIIFGKYFSDEATAIQAKNLKGEEIPVRVHVDEVSMMQLGSASDMSSGARGIRGKQLRPIAEQAAAAINIYTEISGVDYPYGELNIVNDPAPALYGQAPSSLIYLGSLVFRGEGTMAGGSGAGGGTRTAKFLKSVVAHEVGHQWWGSRVANANGRNYWFVESLAEYFSAIYLERIFGPKEYQEQVDEWRRAVLDRDLRASVQNASSLWPGEDLFGSYQAAVYNKGPYAFHMLREIFGDEKFFAALKLFSQELTSKGEIVTRDIQIAAEKAFGGIAADGSAYNADLGWFFDQWIRGTGLPQYTLNYKVRETEDGKYLIEGMIRQRVVVGNKSKYHVMNDTYYRGVVPIVAKSRKNEYSSRIVVEGAETPFSLKVPEEPIEISLNEAGGILAHDVLVGRDF